jgi:glutamine amidotransferase
MKRVAIVDYGMCNLDSVRRAFEECSGAPFVTDEPTDLADADLIVLPGVGAFPDAMANLRGRSLDKALDDEVLGNRVPFLGICLGMQLLATTGHEGGETAGLGWIDADVCRLRPTPEDTRVPHVGWNEVVPARETPLFDDMPQASDFYFVHSYHVECHDDTDVVATTPYCGGFVSAIQRENIFAVQFHPEKSQERGFEVLRRFLAL